MPLKFAALHKGFTTLSTNMHPGTVGVQMLPHGAVVTEHFTAALVRTGNGSGHFFISLFLRFYSEQ